MEYYKECPKCGKTFVTKEIHKKYCSDECRKEATKKVRRVCIKCGLDFHISAYSQIKTCSVCRNNTREDTGQRRYFDEDAPRRVKRCKHCGKEFKEGEIRIDEYGIHPAGVDYCCIQCMEAEEGIEVKNGGWRN